MHRMPQVNKKSINCGQSKRRLIAFLMLLCFVIVPLLTAVVIIIQADHCCIGEYCRVCALVNNAQKLLDRISKAVGAIFVAAGLFTAIAIWSKFDFLFRPCHSNLVSAKIRLNN